MDERIAEGPDVIDDEATPYVSVALLISAHFEPGVAAEVVDRAEQHLLGRLWSTVASRTEPIPTPHKEQLQACMGMPRASYLRVWLDARQRDQTAVLQCMRDLTEVEGLAWACAGPSAFGWGVPDPHLMAQLARITMRLFCVRIEDATVLQWLAPQGLPSIGWCTVVGNRFGAFHGLEAAQVGKAALERAPASVRMHRGTTGWMLQAGDRLRSGDLHRGEDLSDYRWIDALLAPLKLTEYGPLSGPWLEPDFVKAWIDRFQLPQRWLARRADLLPWPQMTAE